MAMASAEATAAEEPHLQLLLEDAEHVEDHHVAFGEEAVSVLDDSHAGIDVSDGPITPPTTDGPTTGADAGQAAATADTEAADSAADETRRQLDKCVPELLPWLVACRTANHGAEDTPASADDAFFFLETNHPELVHTNAYDRLFEWMTSFMTLQHPIHGAAAPLDTTATPLASIERFPESVQTAAVERLAEANDSTSVANEFGLKSTLTLHYWAHNQQQQQQNEFVLETSASDGADHKQLFNGARSNGRFYHQAALLDWILAHQGTPLTRQDVLRHIVTTYPEFAASKSLETLKTWIGRLVKRHLPAMTASGSSSSSIELGADEDDGHDSGDSGGSLDAGNKTDGIDSTQMAISDSRSLQAASPSALDPHPEPASTEAADTSGKRRQKRGASDRYVTHSNEFKLNALQKLDEGFSISEVAEELGLKSQNTLAYWSSIRDKLVMSEKKRFRLAGGGRRSSCSFEEELLTWVTERYQRGEGTDVKSVLEYLQEFHPSFTDGKKEPTLRKWILRFFKRCWRAPSTSNDMEKSCGIDARQALLRNRLLPQARLSRVPIPWLPPSSGIAKAKPGKSGKQKAYESRAIKHDDNVAKDSDRTRFFDQTFVRSDPLLRYVLQVIGERLRVFRADIPKRQLAVPNENVLTADQDVLFLTYDPQPPCGFRNIYWLIFTDEDTVLSSQQKLREYFTLSPFGLTHFEGSSVTEVAELASWIDEKRAFDYMTNMKGLARIQQLLFFCSWKQHAIHHKHRRIRAHLACSLFLCHGVASRLLLHVHFHCIEIEKAAIDNEVDRKRTYSIQEFEQLQLARLKQAQQFLRTQINAVCERISSETQQASPVKSQQTRRHGIPSGVISSSLERANLHERMFTFLRLVDLHITEAIIRHLRIFLCEFFFRVCGRPDRQTSLDGDMLPRTLTIELDYMTWYVEDSSTKSRRDASEPIHQVSFKPYFLLPSRQPPLPFVHVDLQMEQINFEVNSLSPPATDSVSNFVDLAPTKNDIFELIHRVLYQYMTGIDETAHIVLDSRFSHFLAPFAPHQRQRIVSTMVMPSTVIFENFAEELSFMRQTLDTYFMQISLVQAKHLKCFHNIKAAECTLLDEVNHMNGTIKVDTCCETNDRLQSVASAEQYELSQKTWSEFLQYSTKTPQWLQIGCFLIDQRHVLQRIQHHVVSRIAEMDQALPNVYKKFLSEMLVDVDDRIQKVTKIPITIADASVWISQVTEMLPLHTSRQLFDDKCKNLQRLKGLLLARGISFAQTEDFEVVRQKEIEWESTHETLLLCLDRVQERDSEHRRSFQDLASNTSEHICNQLDLIRAEFDTFPTGIENGQIKVQERSIAAKLLNTQQDQLVQRLEEIVHLESEFKSLQMQFSAYDRAYRFMMDMRLDRSCMLAFQDANEMTTHDQKPLPSESLMDYIVTSIDVRKWFTSWIMQQDKWLNAKLESVHPALVLNRIKQFRRRLASASSRMFRRVTVSTLYPSEHQISFVEKDKHLVRVFEKSIQQMMYDYRVFEAVAGGSLTDERWQIVAQLCPDECKIEWNSHPCAKTTLNFLKNKWSADHTENMDVFMDLCDQSILESKLRVKMENIQRTIRDICVQLREQNYVILCDGLTSAIATLEDTHLDVRLLLQKQNPWLEAILQLLHEIERKKMICEHILDFEQQWQLICEMTKVHDIDEFFCGRSSSATSSTKETEVTWRLFLKTTQAWSDNMRRLFCMNSTELVSFQQQQSKALIIQQKNGPTQDNTKIAAIQNPTKTPSTFSCNLDDLVQVFDDFDFDAHGAQCERALQLMRQFLSSLRSKSPRLWCLEDTDCLRLLCRESDSDQLKRSLSICYPHVQQFMFENYIQQSNHFTALSDEEPKQAHDEPNRPQHSGMITITGVANRTLKIAFKTAVVKIGRVNFWLTRLEEELSELVQDNSLQAIHYLVNHIVNPTLGDAITSSQSESVVAGQLLPQSVSFAMIFWFSNQVTKVLNDTIVNSGSPLAQLRTQLKKSMTKLLRILKEPGTTGFSVFDPRVENMILVGLAQQQKLEHIINLDQSQQHDQAQFFWLMQFKIYLGENISTTEKNGEEKRLEQAKPDQLHGTIFQDNNGSSAAAWTAQIERLELPLGRECMGFTRLPVIAPFTERCMFAMYSAIRAHTMTLILPIDSVLPTQPRNQSGYSIFTELSQLLFKASFELRCTSHASAANRLENFMEAIYLLNGFLVVCDFPVLSHHMQSVFHEKMVDEFHKTLSKSNVASRSSSVLVNRKNASLNAAIFIPLNESTLETSKLVRSVQTPFRPVMVTPPSLLFYIEAILLIEGFSPELKMSTNLLPCFEVMSNSIIATGHCIQTMIRKVIKRAFYLTVSSNVIWRKALSPIDSKSRRRSVQNLEADMPTEDRDAIPQIALRQAIEQMCSSALVETASPAFQRNFKILLDKQFPLTDSGKLVGDSKYRNNEDTMKNAIKIYMEHSGLAVNNEQILTCMKVWKVLESYRAFLVYGESGCGKTTCIRTLYNAVSALEVTFLQDGAPIERPTAQHQSPSILVVNAQLLSMDELYGPVNGLITRTLCDFMISESVQSSHIQRNQYHRWIMFDGVLCGEQLDPVLGILESSIMHLAGLNGIRFPLSDAFVNEGTVRVVFEALDLAHVSPSVMVSIGMVYIQPGMISHRDLIDAWRQHWARAMPFVAGSAGAENLSLIFRLAELLLSDLCFQFITNEHEIQDAGSRDDSTDGEDEVKTTENILRLGFLTLNTMTDTSLGLIASLCLHHRSMLEDATRAQVILIVFFSVIWGVAGHLNDSMRHKLDHYLRQQVKDMSDLKSLCDLPGTLFDSERFADYWDDGVLQQYVMAASDTKGQVASNENYFGTREHVVYDSSSGELVIFPQQAVSQLRICNRLLHHSRAFLLLGPPGSGKTSLLRLLYLMNEKNQSINVMDATVESNQSWEALDWMHMPRAWFRPSFGDFTGIVRSSRLQGEDQLLAVFKAGSFIFLDDLSLDATPDNSLQEDFVRFVLDHQLVFSRRHAKMVPLPKTFAATMRLPFDVSLHTRLQPHVERLIRHFAVFQAPNYNRKQLLSIFRDKNQTFFQSTHGNYEGGTASSDLLLSLEESVLRANIDLLVELCTLQQRVCDRRDDALVVFNLHHLNLLLSRTFSFASHLKSIQHKKLVAVSTEDLSNQAPASRSMGTTLVSLGKLHQCWISEVRSVFLRNSASDVGDSHSSTMPSEQHESARKKLWMTLRLISEKYFSVSLRNDDHLVKAEMVYFTLKFVSRPLEAKMPIQDTRLRLEEFMTQFASVSSSSSGSIATKTRRGATVIEGARGEYSLSFLKQVMLQHASMFSGLSTLSIKLLEDISCLDMNLMLTSPFWLNQLLHMTHALGEQMNLIVSTPTGTHAMVSRLLYFACAIHGFQVRIMREHHCGDMLEKFLQAIVSDVVIEGKQISLWIYRSQFCKLVDSKLSTIDASAFNHQSNVHYLIEFIMEIALCQMPSIILRNAQLRDAVITSCIERRQSLQVVTEMDWMLQARDLVQRNLRVCLFDSVQQSKNSHGEHVNCVMTWLKTTKSFQWCILGPVADIEQTMLDMTEATETLISSKRPEKERHSTLKTEKLSCFSWSCLQIHSLALSFPFAPDDPCIQLSYLLSFLENTIVRYHARDRLLQTSIDRRDRALTEFQALEDQLPRLVASREVLENQLKQMNAAHEEALGILDIKVEQQRRKEDAEVIGFIEEDTEWDETIWVLKGRCEEFALHIGEVHARVAVVTRQIAQLESLVLTEGEEASKWKNTLCELQANQQYNNIVSVALQEASEMAYSFVSACSPHQQMEFIEGVKQLLGDDDNENTDSDDGLYIQNLHHTHKNTSTFAEDEENIVKFVWQTRFPFLLDESIYQDLLIADQLCDHVPVFVDSTGLLQHFLIHVFKELPFFEDKLETIKRKDAGHAPRNAMVIRCEDIEFEMKMQEARRRCIPVLLVNFQENLVMGKLLPFLQPPLPQRQPMLHKLTLQSHATFTAQRTKRLASKRKSDARKQSLLTITPSELVNAVNAITTGRRNSLITNADFKPLKLDLLHSKQNEAVTTSGFQVYAVTQLLTPISDRSVASHFAVFSIDWSLKTLESHFHHVCIQTCDPKLFKATQDARQLHVESCLKIIRLEADVWHSLPQVSTTDETQRVPGKQSDSLSVFAESVIELNQEKRKHRSEVFMFNERCDALAVEAQKYASLSNGLAGIAISMTVIGSLLGYGDHSLLHAKNYTWLQHALEQLQAQSRFGSVRRLDLIERATHVEFVTKILHDISYGIMSASHRLIFSFLVIAHRELRHTCTDEVLDEYYQTIAKLGQLTTSKWASATVSGASHLDAKEKKDTPTTIKPPPKSAVSKQSATSIVDKLRRKVRLCSRLLDQLNSNDRKQRVDTMHASRYIPVGGFIKQASASLLNEHRIGIEAQRKLKRLAGNVDAVFCEWKAAQEKSRAELHSILASLGLVARATMNRKRSVTVLDNLATNAAPGGVISLQSKEQLLAQYGVSLSDPHHRSFEKELGRLLVAKNYFPDWFAELLKQYVEKHLPSVLTCSSTTDALEHKSKLQSWQNGDEAECLTADERFHRPQSLLLYNDPVDRHAMEILLLEKWSDSKLITVDLWDKSRLAGTITNCISSKERFMIELMNSEHFDLVLSLVSQLVNQQALLVVPQWYLLCSLQVAQDIMSSRLSLLQQSIIFRDELITARVSDWFARHGIPSKLLATKVAQGILETASGRVVFPIAKHMQDLMLQEKLLEDASAVTDTTASDEAQAHQMHRLLYMIQGQVSEKGDTDKHTQTPQAIPVSSLGMSLELMNDFTFLSQSFGPSAVQFNCVSYSRELFRSLQEVYEIMERALATDSVDEAQTSNMFPWWQVKNEFAAQVRVFEAIHERINCINSISKKPPPELQQAVMCISRGVVPPEWMAIAFNDTIGEAVNTLVALPQLVMLFTCRLAFLGLSMFQQNRVNTLQLAMLSDARAFLLAMKQHCASIWDVPLELVDLHLEIETTKDDEPNGDSNGSSEQVASQTFVFSSDTDGQTCGLRVEGLFVVERVAASVRRPRAQMQLHPLPVCQLWCARAPTEPALAQLPLLMMPSLSPYQHPPTPTQLALVDQVQLNIASLSARVPTISSSDQDLVDFALGFPVFVDEYEQ